ncbi:hypothetical protein [Roseospirillum parvum]|uniref:Uncharacterized protein n=1 Tax=Roseospirillum parvum TaxID=83401 RepID=A0A1G7TI42_9PROT|nr:hypothetical protein [Roseospirillum parvum]SDG34925.1 hypothetical protein SAMN05421742_1013 [Roseospirillum parvum]
MLNFSELLDHLWSLWMGLFTWAPFGETYLAVLALVSVVAGLGYTVAHIMGTADP